MRIGLSNWSKEHKFYIDFLSLLTHLYITRVFTVIFFSNDFTDIHDFIDLTYIFILNTPDCHVDVV